MDDEQRFLSCAYTDPADIDRGVAAGITRGHFDRYEHGEQWAFLVEQRTRNAPTDPASIYAAAVAAGNLDKLGGLAGITAASTHDGIALLHGPACMSVLLSRHARRQAWKLAKRAADLCEKDAADMAAVGQLGEELVAVCAGKQSTHRAVADITNEAKAEAAAEIAGKIDMGTVITTGLARFDKYATPIRSHEYVVVAGRSSHGKSSLMLQIAGHNLARGLRVVVFSLETSDKSVIKQLAAQRAGIDLRDIGMALRERQEKYLKCLDFLAAAKNLLVFDQELSIDAIQARCRLLASSYKPHLVVLDYMGLIIGYDGTAYERVSKLSKAMIPITKSLGCTLMVGCQLNQGSEKEEREPTRTDFRDSGQILEDCHRAIAIWRKPGQKIDQIVYDCELLQLKLRDGPTAHSAVKFNAPHTKFYEEAA